MNSRDQIFHRARQMAAQSPTPTSTAEQLAILGRRGAMKVRRNFGVLHITNADRRSREQIESPRYAWQDRADLA